MASKTAAKYLEWRIDIDYWDSLPPQALAYLVDFIQEFYQNDGPNSPERRDILTVTEDQAVELTLPRQRAYYTPDDYKEDRCPRSAPTRKTRPSE